MSVSIRVPEWVAKAIREHVAEDGWVGMDGQDAVAHLRKLLEPKPAPRRRASLLLAHPKPEPGSGKRATRARRKTEAEVMREVRAALVRRSPSGATGCGLCEWCRAALMEDPHHIFGAGNRRTWPSSERTCAGLCRSCHERITNAPDRDVMRGWWEWVWKFLVTHGYEAEAAEAWRRLETVRFAMVRAAAQVEHHG